MRSRLKLWWSVPGFLALILANDRIGAKLEATSAGTDPNAPLRVTSSADAGRGSLREAITAAARIERRAYVSIETELVRVTTPLPPVVNARGVVIDCPNRGCVLEADPELDAPVLHVLAPTARLNGLTIRNAATEALRVRADHVNLFDLTLEHNGTAIYVMDGSEGLVVDSVRFFANSIGVRVDDALPRANVRRSTFRDHSNAGVWAVTAEQPLASQDVLWIHESRFENNRIGVVALHVPTFIERSEFRGSKEVAIHIGGIGQQVHENRIHEGLAAGILGVDLRSSRVVANEIDHNLAIGLFVRHSGLNELSGNRIYENGYGIVDLFGNPDEPNVLDRNLLMAQRHDAIWLLSSSPVVRMNRAMNNRGAGIRVLRYRDDPEPRPFLTGNHLVQNGARVEIGVYNEAEQ